MVVRNHTGPLCVRCMVCTSTPYFDAETLVLNLSFHNLSNVSTTISFMNFAFSIFRQVQYCILSYVLSCPGFSLTQPPYVAVDIKSRRHEICF